MATTKKRTGAEEEKPKRKTAGAAGAGGARGTGGTGGAGGTARKGAAKRATPLKRAASPRIRSSHAAGRPAEGGPSAGRAGAGEGSGARKRPAKRATGDAASARKAADRPATRARREPREDLDFEIPGPPPAAPPAAPARKSPLAAPKRAQKRAAPPPPQPSSEARELALALAAAGLDKKAIGVEILEVAGRVDYADYLVIMTGRSDRHVHSIATGIEDALRQKKMAPLSIEGLGAATWVLIDFGDVVVHVFQEDTRRLYDIEGLWMDAGRVPVPGADAEGGGLEGGSSSSSGPATVTRILPG